MIVVGFDPGNTTGWAAFETEYGEAARPIGYGQVPFLELITTLEETEKIQTPDVVVIETFQLLPSKAQKLIGSKFEVSQAQGICKSYAKRHGAKIIEQRPTIKPLAQKMTQVFPPKNHKFSHWVDAYNHARYWMIHNNMDKSQLAQQGGNP